jgi:hypothetical protein
MIFEEAEHLHVHRVRCLHQGCYKVRRCYRMIRGFENQGMK